MTLDVATAAQSTADCARRPEAVGYEMAAKPAGAG
jgi:hypothetical protein